jgi:hypothetical protein
VLIIWSVYFFEKKRFICFAGSSPVKFCSDVSRNGVAENEESHKA